MQNKKFYRLVVLVIFQIVLVTGLQAQEASETKADLSVAGIELGNRESAEKFLKDGYSPRIEEDGRVSYAFYNEWATQVMRLYAPSMEDKYFITEIEVYRVGRSYKERHFHLKDVELFQTDGGVFIGFKQSAAFLIAGIKNAGKINEFKPKHIVKQKGEPTERVEKPEEKRETLIYKTESIKLSDETTAKHEAEYEFYKDKLKKFRVKIESEKSMLAKK